MGITATKVRDPKLRFEIKPRERGDGFTLNSKLLLYPHWYPNLNAAISYARFLGKAHGCRIQIFNTEGEMVESKLIEGERR